MVLHSSRGGNFLINLQYSIIEIITRGQHCYSVVDIFWTDVVMSHELARERDPPPSSFLFASHTFVDFDTEFGKFRFMFKFGSKEESGCCTRKRGWCLLFAPESSYLQHKHPT
jgi:hypothetical protein